ALGFLRDYLGAAPSEYQRARFFLMRQTAHLFYAIAFLTLGAAHGPAAASMDYVEFHRRVWAAEIDMEDLSIRSTYGRVHWNRFLENLSSEGFDEALSSV
ncbi:MAG: hypothetical protein KGN84_12480, partial [Acidobacteriota bacterium]|nr:hypothetical protein [Acidobacteriota bacterium]